MGKRRKADRVMVEENPKERGYREDVDVDGKVIFK
jgi:hypothetical protein